MSGRALKRVLFATFAILVASPPASAQRWSVEAQAGRIRSALDPAGVSSQTVAVGLRFDDLNSALGLSLGVPTSSSEPLWGALSGSHRLALYRSGWVAGVDLAGSGYLLHDRITRTREAGNVLGPPRVIEEPNTSGTAFAGHAMPLIGFEAGKFQLQARAGVSHYSSRFGEAQRTRTVLLSDLQLTFAPTAFTAVIPTIRRFDADGNVHTYAGISGVVANHAVSVWGSAGQWLKLDSAGTAWAAGGTWQLHRRASLSVNGRHDAFDALYLNPPQTSWSIGLSVQVGGAPALPAPVPAAYVNGRAIIRLDADHADEPPRIAGDFTNWKPQPMQRSGDAWTYTAQVEPGVYNYAFVDNSGEWFVPKDHPGRKDDGMGGSVAVLVVR